MQEVESPLSYAHDAAPRIGRLAIERVEEERSEGPKCAESHRNQKVIVWIEAQLAAGGGLLHKSIWICSLPSCKPAR